MTLPPEGSADRERKGLRGLDRGVVSDLAGLQRHIGC